MPRHVLEVAASRHVQRTHRVCRRFSEPGVRLYGHPGLLAVAEAVNGAGFTPFSDSLQVKIARLGPAVAWRERTPCAHRRFPPGLLPRF